VICGTLIASTDPVQTESLFPDGPRVVNQGGRHFVLVGWEEAESVRQLLVKRGYRATLCLNPETREAQLELWPDVKPDEVLAVLEARKSAIPGAGLPVAADTERAKTAVVASAAEPIDLICI
jgi:hypothetical protein